MWSWVAVFTRSAMLEQMGIMLCCYCGFCWIILHHRDTQFSIFLVIGYLFMVEANIKYKLMQIFTPNMDSDLV